MAGLGHAGNQSRVCQGRGRRPFPRRMAGKELGPKGSSDTVSAGNAWRRALEKPGRRAWHPCQDDRFCRKAEHSGSSRQSVFPQIFPFGLRKNGMLVHPSNLRGAGAETVSAYGVPPRCYPRTLAALLRNPGYPGHDRLYAQSHP